jgi:GNAT superfamily N-acetyltransferase
MLIRSYEDRDGTAVRQLFIRVNRELAPDGLREQFESYIAQSLEEEIDRIPTYYAGRHGSFWVVENSGVLVGMYGLERIGRETAELRRMYVAPEARRRGIAKAMLDHAEHKCREAGVYKLTLSTSELQKDALALYHASGFHLVREELARTRTNKTVGASLRRFHFEKPLNPGQVKGPPNLCGSARPVSQL